ncbi:precorrin-6A reductase [Wansuia hejianensis]|uniref:Precorrin-6A reductase n=1 Tax=Wansuia hejianensis TaxID=2763667 RepID=A0A926EZS8_9FIRM|nr:precorrin-6A reductase [Wansuia hejianensis]MBC8591398.1 precorrin-6A reductase [Wansuia hejianensis]
MIWIIGGTSEGRKLIQRIKDLDNFIVTVATESGREFIDSEKLKVGRMTYKEMGKFIDNNNIKVIIDLTHPFAKIVSSNARKIAYERKIDYIRYTREKTEYTYGISLKSYEEAYEYLKTVKGTVFFTTGSKNIGDFEKIRGDNRFIYRIIPALESIKECINNNIHIRDIIAVVGPFSVEYNKIMFQEYKSDYVIMKDSGAPGGTIDKIKACKELGIVPIIIEREEEKGIDTLEELEDIIRMKYNKE